MADRIEYTNDEIHIITEVLHVAEKEITNIQKLEKGMTNRSFLFNCKKNRYIMRIPGIGTEKLINREQETLVYETLKGRDISDEIIYINPDNGYKISVFWKGARVCNPDNEEDLKICMKKLKNFHNLQLKTEHEFDIFQKIDFYESLWNGKKSVYTDYDITKFQVFSLREYVERYTEMKCLVHMDAVSDNFLIIPDKGVRIIDWEYAGMQDPHVDIAMFCIYALYDRDRVDRLIDIYFDNNCKRSIRIKIYCYIAMCGLLWSNWCEYKKSVGIDFGQYALRQYRYAKEYYAIVTDELRDFACERR